MSLEYKKALLEFIGIMNSYKTDKELQAEVDRVNGAIGMTAETVAKLNEYRKAEATHTETLREIAKQKKDIDAVAEANGKTLKEINDKLQELKNGNDNYASRIKKLEAAEKDLSDRQKAIADKEKESDNKHSEAENYLAQAKEIKEKAAALEKKLTRKLEIIKGE